MQEPLSHPITAAQREVVRALKHPQDGDVRPRIAIRHETGAYLGALCPLTQREAEDPEICSALTRWRHAFKENFLTQFDATPARTQRWLTNVVLPDDTRILFLMRDRDGQPVGNIGMCHIRAENAEVDNVIRGEKGGDARLAFFAELALLAWGYAELDLPTACLHVFSTNERAMRLYHSVGFVECARCPLWQTEVDGEIHLTTNAARQALPTAIDLVRMELTREEFGARHTWIYSLAKGGVWTR